MKLNTLCIEGNINASFQRYLHGYYSEWTPHCIPIHSFILNVEFRANLRNTRREVEPAQRSQRKPTQTQMGLFHQDSAGAEPVLPWCLLRASPHFVRFENQTLHSRCWGYFCWNVPAVTFEGKSEKVQAAAQWTSWGYTWGMARCSPAPNPNPWVGLHV